MPTRRLRGPARSRADTARFGSAPQHARHAGQLVQARSPTASVVRHRHVVPLHPVELGVHHVVDRVLKEVADHQHGHAQRNGERREAGLDRVPFELPDDHQRDRRHEVAQAQPLEDRRPEARRAVRAASPRPAAAARRARPSQWRPAPRPPVLTPTAATDDRRDRCGTETPGSETAGRTSPVTSQPNHAPPGMPIASDAADDQQHELDVVPADFEVRVAERLERRDLLPLAVDRARHDHVDQKRRHAQEDRRREQPHVLVLVDLVLDELVRDLVLAVVGAQAAVGFDQLVDPLDDVGDVGAAHQRDRQVVERAVQVVGHRQRLFVHPQHAEVAVVGHHVARLDLVDVLGRQHDADDPQLLHPAVDDRGDVVADSQVVGVDERLAGQHFVVAARREPASRGAETAG